MISWKVLLFLIICSVLYPEIHPDNYRNKSATPILLNRVHRSGKFWLNVTNAGYFGNPDELTDPCTGKTAISGELPGGSGTGFMFVSGLMFGGYLDSATVNVGDTQAKLFQGPLVTTAYEGWLGSPMPKELWAVNFDEDPSGTTLGILKETSNVEGKISCLFEEVYDPLATAEEQFSTMYTDKYVAHTYTGMDSYDNRQHIPLGIEVRQKSYAWSYDYAQKFIIVDYTIYNRNDTGSDIYDFFIGLYLDPDIGHTSGISPGTGQSISANHADDIGGFIHKWEYYDDATGELKTADLNLAWAADNDGRNYTGTHHYIAQGEPGAGEPLDGATSVLGVKVLRCPDNVSRFSYNIFSADSHDEGLDWGPRWQTGLHPRPLQDHPDDPAHDHRAVPWNYDLSMHQKGYDDTNIDSLRNGYNQPMYGGRTEGRPIGDRGRYMVMSNDEFDYDQIDMREVYLGVYEESPYIQGTPYSQAEKWQKWTTSADLGNEGFSQDIADGDIATLNEIANGRDIKAVLSFGPLGYEDYVNIGFDPDSLCNPQAVIQNKKIWRFAHGDSLKLTLAFIVSENFHTSLDQDPNYADDTIVNLADGLQKDLFENGWYDALYNVVWTERLFDIPMHDTPVTKNGITRGDGWYGEDVGKDGLFSIPGSDSFCWWFDEQYPGPDSGEGNLELDFFSNPRSDIYGHTAHNEDTLLPFGRQNESSDGFYRSTADHGCMVKYYRSDGYFPQGTLVRYGFENGRLDAGDGVPDFTGPPPPPAPRIEAGSDGKDIVINWSSHEFYTLEDGLQYYTGPEHYADPFSRIKDFESYTIYVSPNSDPDNFVSLVTFDNVNYAYESVSSIGKFLDFPFGESVKDSLVAAGESVIVSNGKIWQIAPYGNNRDLRSDHFRQDVYSFTSRCDTILYNESPVAVSNYKFRLYGKFIENINYISVISSDFGDPKMGVPPVSSNYSYSMKKIGTDIGEDDELLPFTTELYQNYPNPFNPDTKISFSLSKKGIAELNIYNVSGQLVQKLAKEEFDAGHHNIIFNADGLNSGVYFCSLKAGGKNYIKKMLMIK